MTGSSSTTGSGSATGSGSTTGSGSMTGSSSATGSGSTTGSGSATGSGSTTGSGSATGSGFGILSSCFSVLPLSVSKSQRTPVPMYHKGSLKVFLGSGSFFSSKDFFISDRTITFAFLASSILFLLNSSKSMSSVLLTAWFCFLAGFTGLFLELLVFFLVFRSTDLSLTFLLLIS